MLSTLTHELFNAEAADTVSSTRISKY